MAASAPPPSLPALPCAPDRADEFIGAPPPEVVRALAAHPGPAVVLGAGGKLGLHTTYMMREAFRALGRRDPVWAVSRFRTLRSREDFERRGLETISCDLEDPAALAALPEAATVVFLAGIKFGTSGAPDLLRRLNVEMPRKVAERFRRSRIVAFSTGAVYPFMPVGGPGANESTPRGPVGDYAASCVEREKAFEEAARQHGTKVALIRLNYSVEFRYGVLVDIAQWVRRQEPIDLAMGRLNLIWQTDAIAHSLQALDLADSPAAPVNVTGTPSYSVRDLAARFGRIFGVEPRLVGREAETAALSDASYAIRRFGPPRVSIDEMIAWTAAWLRDVGTSWGKPTGFENRNGAY
jgi:nucleoside-diphosphate-sugar epimerase